MKVIITKEDLINNLFNEMQGDYILKDDLLKFIDNATDAYGFVSKKKLIKSIRGNHTKAVVKDVYKKLENIIFNTLCSVDEKQDVCIKLFEGISLDGKYVPEKTKNNNLTGETSFVKSKIKPKFNITRSYCEKLNDK